MSRCIMKQTLIIQRLQLLYVNCAHSYINVPETIGDEEKAGVKANRHESPLEICWAISGRRGRELLLLKQFVVFSEQMGGNLSVTEDESHK